MGYYTIPTMYKYLIPVAILLLFISCNKGLDGKIETRSGDKMYLVNTSPEKPFKFTIKTTEIANDSTNEYYTAIIELAPGDEKYLGTAKAPTTELSRDEVIGEKRDNILRQFRNANIMDSSAEIKLTTQEVSMNYKYEYRITGQQEINTKK